jgi:hypothetical protein
MCFYSDLKGVHMTENQKTAYLEDHLPYEILMLRYTFQKIMAFQSQLDWNAYYESFVLHARNLYLFLTNGDGSNAKASDFIAGFKAQKTNETISAFQRLGTQVFHLGPARPSDELQKVAIVQATVVNNWLDQNFSSFIDGLDEKYRLHWQPGRADPAQAPGQIMRFGYTGPSATNHIIVVQTENFTK